MDTEHYSLLDNLRDIVRYPAFVGMRLAAALVVAAAVTLGALLISYLADLLSAYGWARTLVTILGSAGLVFAYYFFLLPFLLLLRTAHVSVLARLRSSPAEPTEIEKNPIHTITHLLAEQFENPRQVWALFWQVTRIVKTAHRRLIDIATVIPWLRRIKASRIITEILGGTARHLAAAIIGRVVQHDRGQRNALLRQTILHYAIHWKDISPVALRAQMTGLVIWLVVSALLFVTGLTSINAFAGFWLWIISFVATLASARLISHACYDALGEIKLINALPLMEPDAKEAEIWDKRLASISREYRTLDPTAYLSSSSSQDSQ